MAKSLVLGNGNLLVGFDWAGQVRDFYFPYVGLENHMTRSCGHHLGVWVADRVYWLDGGDWKISVAYQKETLASDIRAVHEGIGIELCFVDVVYNERDIFLRKVEVRNLRSEARAVKVFFGQQFYIAGINHGNTAYYDPNIHSMIHYKGNRVFLIGGRAEGNDFDDYGCGIFHAEGKEGVWRDAEDGTLEKIAIEHGSVDSAIGFAMDIPGGEKQTIYYWIAVADSMRGVRDHYAYLIRKTPEHLLETTQDFWHAWVNKMDFSFFDVEPQISDFFKRSLLIIRTHVDNRGGILASGDADMLNYGKDTYGYVWPRDAAYAAMALDRAGYTDVTRNFFEFCNAVIEPEGYFFHKYQTDRSYGSSWHPWVLKGRNQLPIQVDETAIVVHAFWKHYEISRDLEFVEGLYNSLIKKAADFLDAYRDDRMRLPKSSYDLWEEKWGVSTYTCSVVFAALNAAASFARVLGKEDDESRYRKAALEVKNGILSMLYEANSGIFYKLVVPEENKTLYDATVDASSFYGIFRFGVLDPNDERCARFAEIVRAALSRDIGIGGIARYDGDGYYRVNAQTPGNPWVIPTLWLAQYEIAKARTTQELRDAKRWFQWTMRYALPSGILSEQIHPGTGEQISASPLTWSHAEFATSVFDYMEARQKLAARGKRRGSKSS